MYAQFTTDLIMKQIPTSCETQFCDIKFQKSYTSKTSETYVQLVTTVPIAISLRLTDVLL
jgi:hypothetical protein